jgi:hypothetical protein
MANDQLPTTKYEAGEPLMHTDCPPFVLSAEALAKVEARRAKEGH